MTNPVGSPTQCAVSHAPGYVPGNHEGEIRLYRALRSAATLWLCDADAASAPERGVPVVLVDEGVQ